MNLIKQKELKEKMLEIRPRFMEDNFKSGAERANKARKEMEVHFESIKDTGINDSLAKKIDENAGRLSLGITHAAFSYSHHDDNQVYEINEIMRNANKMIQNYGEYLNKVIHNYPFVGESFEHIYDIMEDYYKTNEGMKLQEDINKEQAKEMSMKHEPQHRYEPSPSSPGLSL